MKTLRKSYASSLLLAFVLLLSACEQKAVVSVQSGNLILEVNNQLHTRILSPGVSTNDFQASEYLETADGPLTDYELTGTSTIVSDSGQTTVISGVNNRLRISKTLSIFQSAKLPNILQVQVTYLNDSDVPLVIRGWRNHSYSITPDSVFWAFQGSSSGARADWINPVTDGYYQENFMGMNDTDYGGGTPVTDLWQKRGGVAIGSAATTPLQISLPTERRKGAASVQISLSQQLPYPTYLEPGEKLETTETFLAIHEGDYFNALRNYSAIMQSKGLRSVPSEPAAFESIWCAWGYERDFTLAEIIGTLPKVKELGIKWAVLDDGFQQAEGDWQVSASKFPKGSAQMKALVQTIHAHGLKAKLWWAPLAADPHSQLLQQNPDMRLFQEDGSPQYITWWDAYYLSPNHPQTIQHTKETIRMFLDEWGFDGLKMDGQHMNAIAPDYNEENGLEDGAIAPEKLPDFFRMIYEEANQWKPNAVIENCPCGTCMSYFNMMYANQTVSSDPLSSWQIRLKGKTYKALIPQTAYFGDHVELSDGGNDFASSFGIGAVLGTKFTWPANNPTASGDFLLTPEKEVAWKKWFSLYDEKMLSKGEYLGGLYDIAFDLPETHVISKDGRLHYAFYAPHWSGSVTLRGLDSAASHTIYDYFSGREITTLAAGVTQLNVDFDQFLLIEAIPQP